jgi:catechol 2,3-dioxygenase-like lactoylglutathione lyase family enzyme
VFGCRVKPPERRLSGDWLDRGTGLKGAKLAGVHLLLPGHGEKGPTLEIFTYEDQRGRPPVMPNTTGLTHLAFEVEDVNETAQRVLTHGGSMLGETVSREIEGAGLLTFLYCRDPEGNILEIQSWT